jgi:antitoxin VapB
MGSSVASWIRIRQAGERRELGPRRLGEGRRCGAHQERELRDGARRKGVHVLLLAPRTLTQVRIPYEEEKEESNMSIQSKEAEVLADELARETGETPAQAVVRALEERLAREAIMEVSRRCSALPDLDTRSPDEILGYDEVGLPD